MGNFTVLRTGKCICIKESSKFNIGDKYTFEFLDNIKFPYKVTYIEPLGKTFRRSVNYDEHTFLKIFEEVTLRRDRFLNEILDEM